MKFLNPQIQRIADYFSYGSPVEYDCDDEFLEDYRFFSEKKKISKNPDLVFATLEGSPNCTHIAAKKLLFQENENCWKYFGRASCFLSYGAFIDGFFDHTKSAFEYGLYSDQKEIVLYLIDKMLMGLKTLENSDFYKNQEIYPSTFLVHFLIEKWLGENPIFDRIKQLGFKPGVYQPVVENWPNLEEIDNGYWGELVDYHLGRVLEKDDDKASYEFELSGLVPMELINIILVNESIDLNDLFFNHELFESKMAAIPRVGELYRKELDVKFMLVLKTYEDKIQYSVEEIVDYLYIKYGSNSKLFY